MVKRDIKFFPDHNPQKAELKGTLEVKKDGRKVIFDDVFSSGLPPFPGYSNRATILAMEPYKKLIENVLEGITIEFDKYKIPPKQMCPISQAMFKAFDKLIALEETGRMKKLFKRIRDLICFLLEEDTSYRWRVQLFLTKLLDIKKLKMTKTDMFWFGTRKDLNLSQLKDEDIELVCSDCGSKYFKIRITTLENEYYCYKCGKKWSMP